MIVYKPGVADGYQWVLPEESRDYEILRKLRGERQGDRWTPMRVRLLKVDEGQQLRRSDMPWQGSHALILTQRAMDVLRDIPEADCEFLPLACDDEKLWLMNPKLVTEALNEEESRLERFSSSGRIMRVMHYVFREEALRGLWCFRIPQQLPVYVTDRFVSAVNGAGLQGIHFDIIWQS